MWLSEHSSKSTTAPFGRGAGTRWPVAALDDPPPRSDTAVRTAGEFVVEATVRGRVEYPINADFAVRIKGGSVTAHPEV